MTRIRSLALTLILLLCAGPRAALAGECISGEPGAVESLEAFAYRPLDVSRGGVPSCLFFERHSETNRWAGPIMAAYFRGLREGPYRDRVAAACLRILGRADSSQVDAAAVPQVARALARYGFQKAGERDVLDLLLAQRWRHVPYVDLAALGDPQAVGFLAARYDSLRALGITDKARREELVSILNCLYHIPGEDVPAFARQRAAQETDSFMKSRITRILERG